MKYVLIYNNRKLGEPVVYDVSTTEQKAKAFLDLFKYLAKEWGVYAELPKKQQELYEAALKGDENAASVLLHLRKNYEYEQWFIVAVEKV